ncbi:class I SAM-dependent DNA methyltransferase [Pontibacillus litoralis]|uniref:Methyltransferase n=1 Tax=Pontibacillus litoralis JSM 072002 TaxID=1385512 RepID=A0A0A5GCT1_9BACI|nr:class I SAM-dependent methyltransferase [Pontibacillus litoralis]KGX88940.1 methyltransferase [Pontibacillus litoralis JSM 072002]
MSYGRFAQLYDRFMQDVPYDEWLNFTLEQFNHAETDIQHVADLGAGTGELTLRLHQHGYAMTGVDLSEEMLTIAQQKAIQQNAVIQWVQTDITRHQEGLRFDGVVCYCDVVNYLTRDGVVERFFQNVYHMLQDGGMFLFDVHSINYVENFLANQTFAHVTDDISYIWFCDQIEGTPYYVSHDLTFFVKQGENYERFDEFHKQRTYSVQQYMDWLIATGFEIVNVHADFQLEPGYKEDEHDRIFFVCRKSQKQEEA